MSVSDKEISSVEDSGVGVGGSGGSGGGDHDDDDDDDEKKTKKNSGEVHQKHHDDDHHKTKERGSFSGFSRNLGKAKSFVQKPFNKKLSRKSSKSHVKASSSFSASGVSRSSGKRIIDFHGGKSCFFCFTPTPSGESAVESQPSDPNDPTFTYDMLRVLMETSDFYAKECNTHLDSDVSCTKD